MTNQDRIYGLSGKCSSCEFCDDYEQEHAYGSTFVIERWRDCGNGYARKVMDAMFNRSGLIGESGMCCFWKMEMLEKCEKHGEHLKREGCWECVVNK